MEKINWYCQFHCSLISAVNTPKYCILNFIMENPRHINSSENKKGKFMCPLLGFNNYSHIAKLVAALFSALFYLDANFVCQNIETLN